MKIESLQIYYEKKEKKWKETLEKERIRHEEYMTQNETTFSGLEEKMKEYEEISLEIRQISADISLGTTTAVSEAENIKHQVILHKG